jgi:hypothetical protein
VSISPGVHLTDETAAGAGRQCRGEKESTVTVTVSMSGQRQGQRSQRGRGQVAVETALVMPMFVFLILGLLQLGLAHQARLMTKFAAYKAARAGSIHGAKKEVMENAALAVLLPVSAEGKATDRLYSALPGQYGTSFKAAQSVQGSNPLFDLIICDPLKGKTSGDFDDPTGNLGAINDWKQFNHSRLSVQVSFYYRLVIPFANGVLWWMAFGGERNELYRTLRVATHEGTQALQGRKKGKDGKAKRIADFEGKAGEGIYILPIRASWSMHMQSNFLADDKTGVNDKNECLVAWTPPPNS